MKTRSLLFVVTALALAACQEDLTAEKAAWQTTTTTWAARMEKVKKGHELLAARLKVFAVPETEAAIVEEKASIDQALATGATAITHAQHEIDTAKSAIEGLIARGKRLQVEVALGNTKSTVDGSIARAESLVSSANSGLDTLTKKIASAKLANDAAKARTDAWLVEVKKKGGALQVDDLVFNGEVLDAEKSKASLEGLAATLKSCAELKVELSVVARGEAADLGNKRAEALKTNLTANGVSGATLAKVGGTVVADGEETVAFAVTAPCK